MSTEQSSQPADDDAWMDPCIAIMLVAGFLMTIARMPMPKGVVSFQAVCGMALGIIVSALAGVRFLDACKHRRRAPWSLYLVMFIAGGMLSMLWGIPAIVL